MSLVVYRYAATMADRYGPTDPRGCAYSDMATVIALNGKVEMSPGVVSIPPVHGCPQPPFSEAGGIDRAAGARTEGLGSPFVVPPAAHPVAGSTARPTPSGQAASSAAPATPARDTTRRGRTNDRRAVS